MIANAERMVAYLSGLRRESGAYADSSDGEGNLRATLSVLKALAELGALKADPGTVGYVRSCAGGSGGFSIQPEAEPSPFDTAQGLIALKTLDQSALLVEYLPAALGFMSAGASTQYDHFMLIAAYEECGVTEPVPRATIEFFKDRLHTSLAAGKVVDAAIAGASLMRAGQALDDQDLLTELILSGQKTPDGGFGDAGTSSLFASYCALRALVLLNRSPNTRRLSAYLNSLRTDWGYTDVAGGKTTAGATYQNLGMQAWLRQLQGSAVMAARDGRVDDLQLWLSNGGDPDLYDAAGWTVLLAAAARGQAGVVDLLLNHHIAGAPRATTALRYEAADALPIYMAGQAGDVETVRLLLKAEPTHLHAPSSVNGHTVLLQAAFYGKAKHLDLASYLLDNAASISQRPADELADEQAKLLSATNVRGYSALTMQDLWHNQRMKDLLLRYYPADLGSDRGRHLEEKRLQYFNHLKLAIASPQALTESLLTAIAGHLEGGETGATRHRIDTILAHPAFDINRLGGELQMPPLVFAITGVDVGDPARAERRHELARQLLAAGADPAVREKHPMGVGAVIRASVLNNFGLLKLLAEYMTPEVFAREMNVSPAVNGLTAMHDAIHRALTSPPAELDGHLAQIAWMIERGASLDIPDHTGQTQYQLAESAQNDSAFPAGNVKQCWQLIRGAGHRTRVHNQV